MTFVFGIFKYTTHGIYVLSNDPHHPSQPLVCHHTNPPHSPHRYNHRKMVHQHLKRDLRGGDGVADECVVHLGMGWGEVYKGCQVPVVLGMRQPGRFFDEAMNWVLDGVGTLDPGKRGKGDAPDFRVAFDNFDSFARFFRLRVDPDTGQVDKRIVGAYVYLLLDSRWGKEAFQFNEDGSAVDAAGTFDLHFDGNKHHVRLHAWVEIGQCTQHVVDVHIRRKQKPCCKCS